MKALLLTIRSIMSPIILAHANLEALKMRMSHSLGCLLLVAARAGAGFSHSFQLSPLAHVLSDSTRRFALRANICQTKSVYSHPWRLYARSISRLVEQAALASFLKGCALLRLGQFRREEKKQAMRNCIEAPHWKFALCIEQESNEPS